MKTPLALALALALGLSAPLHAETAPAAAATRSTPMTANPFFAPSPLPYQLPHFDRIRDEH